MQRPPSLSDVILPCSYCPIPLWQAVPRRRKNNDHYHFQLFVKAVENPSSRFRVHSDSKSKRITRGNAHTSDDSGHYRHSSMLSFAGFDSFAEVKREFKFRDNCPNFYIHRKAMSHDRHGEHESMISMASILSSWTNHQ